MTEDARPSTAAQRRALKTAKRHVVRLVGGGLAASLVSRVREAAISKYLAQEMSEVHMPVDVVLDLELDAGHPAITEKLAEMQGFALVRVTRGSAKPITIHEIGQLMRGSSEASAAALDALADGKFTAAEVRDVNEFVEGMIRSWRDFQSRLRVGLVKEGEDGE